MKEFTRPEAVILSYPLRSLGDPDDFLFLDIETTGLTPETAQIYLIGTLSHTEDTGWTLRQWFADSLSSEEEILRAFFAFASPFKTLVHYNGDGFDLPFLKAVRKEVHVPVIASGGCGSLEHFHEVFAQDAADAALAASLFHYGELTVGDVKNYLKEKGIPVRL